MEEVREIKSELYLNPLEILLPFCVKHLCPQCLIMCDHQHYFISHFSAAEEKEQNQFVLSDTSTLWSISEGHLPGEWRSSLFNERSLENS